MKLQHIIEARSNPESNKREDFIEILNKINNRIKDNNEDVNDYIVSFMNINKTGINPSTTYNTPVGLYCYPFKYIKANTQHSHNSLDIRPFPPSKVNYIKIYKIKNKTKLINIEDNIKQSHKDTLVNDFVLSFSKRKNDIDMSIDDVKNINTYADLWRLLYGQLLKNTRHMELAKKATMFFRRLDIDGIIDNGYSVIHINEPTQIVIFNTTILETIEVTHETSVTSVFHKSLDNINEVKKLINYIQEYNSLYEKDEFFYILFNKLMRQWEPIKLSEDKQIVLGILRIIWKKIIYELQDEGFLNNERFLKVVDWVFKICEKDSAYVTRVLCDVNFTKTPNKMLVFFLFNSRFSNIINQQLENIKLSPFDLKNIISSFKLLYQMQDFNKFNINIHVINRIFSQLRSLQFDPDGKLLIDVMIPLIYISPELLHSKPLQNYIEWMSYFLARTSNGTTRAYDEKINAIVQKFV